MAERVSVNEAFPLLQGVTEWEELGLNLGLSDAVIREIRSMIGDVSIKRMVMMSKWIQSDLEATWSKLAKALLKMNPPYKVVAAKIRQQRGLSPETRKELVGEKCKLKGKLIRPLQVVVLFLVRASPKIGCRCAVSPLCHYAC
jgi:hypothetical protein